MSERMKTPNSKSQTPNKCQVTNFKIGMPRPRRLARAGLEFGIWSLFGFWILGFGISAFAADTKPLYQNDFSKAEVGKLPELVSYLPCLF